MKSIGEIRYGERNCCERIKCMSDVIFVLILEKVVGFICLFGFKSLMNCVLICVVFVEGNSCLSGVFFSEDMEVMMLVLW